MPTALDVATATRESVSAPVSFTAVDGFDEYVDSDNYTRALVTRDTPDAPAFVIYARGAHRDIVSAHNERSRLTFERAAAAAELDKLADPDGDDSDDAATLREIILDAETAAAALVKTRAVPTLHVARALAHYAPAE